MSSTGRPKADGTKVEKNKDDAYYTDHQVALAVVDLLPIRDGTRILEPSAGQGRFVTAIRQRFGAGPHVEALELHRWIHNPALPASEWTDDDPDKIATVEKLRNCGANQAWVGDFLKWDPRDPGRIGIRWRENPRFDLIVGNPPYSAAEAHVRRAYRLLPVGGALVFVLRSGFLGSGERDDLFGQFIGPEGRGRGDLDLKHIIQLVPRPSFTESGGTDSAEYVALWWERGYRGPVTWIRRNWRKWNSWWKENLKAESRAALDEAGYKRPEVTRLTGPERESLRRRSAEREARVAATVYKPDPPEMQRVILAGEGPDREPEP